ncbi:hypothetical protein XPA_010279 [Xanthoria parietina]
MDQGRLSGDHGVATDPRYKQERHVRQGSQRDPTIASPKVFHTGAIIAGLHGYYKGQETNMGNKTFLQDAKYETSSKAVARESQHIQAAHTEFEDIELKCFVKSLRFLSYGGNITNRSASYLVYVRMPSSENRQVAPEVNTKVSIEWLRGIGHQHPPEERKHQLAFATAADFCILVQHEAGQKKPMIHEYLDRDGKKTVWARLTIYFDESLAQNQLDAVNNFCTSHREPVKRLRSLSCKLDTKLEGYKFDVRGPDIGPDEQQAWEDHIQRLGQQLNPQPNSSYQQDVRH